MNQRDPIGLYKLINGFKTKHNEATIDEEQFEQWLNNPVTKRLMEETQVELLEVALGRGESTAERIEAGNELLKWKPSELRNGD